MIGVRVHEEDRQEAVRAVEAVRRGDAHVWDDVQTGAFQRYGGVERLMFALAEYATHVDRDCVRRAG